MRYYIIFFMMVTSAAYAESAALNLSLPGSGSNYQSDKFRAGDLDCSNAIGSATNLEFGVTGIINPSSNLMEDEPNVGVFARITIPLGKKPKSRIDCNKLYELELEMKRLEVQKLKKELQQLQDLQFEE
jgi:hypothetical protein